MLSTLSSLPKMVTPGMSFHSSRLPSTVIVALGDSLTAGLGLPEKDSFPAQLEKALLARGQEVKVVNAGVSGDTAAAGLARLDWAMPGDASAVIIELGGNDALQGFDPEAPRNLGKDYVDQFRAIYADLARRYDLVFYPFFLDGVALDDQYTQEDGLHPNAQGVARIVERMLPKVEELLERVSANSSDGQSLR